MDQVPGGGEASGGAGTCAPADTGEAVSEHERFPWQQGDGGFSANRRLPVRLCLLRERPGAKARKQEKDGCG